MTTINEVTEVLIGRVRLVDVPPTRRNPWRPSWRPARGRPWRTTSGWCCSTAPGGARPPLPERGGRADRSEDAGGPGGGEAGPGRRQRAGARARTTSACRPRRSPGFYLLGKDLSPTDGINGGEWDDDTADNAGPAVLEGPPQGGGRKHREPCATASRAPAPTLAPAPALERYVQARRGSLSGEASAGCPGR